jgi:alginate O-acetyltransferase complex protein AlgI
MLFSEPAFLFAFLPVLLALWLVLPRTFHNLLLLAFSVFFYAYGEPHLTPALLGSIVFNYGVGLGVHGASGVRARKVWFGVGIGGNLLLLTAFKYGHFLVENLNHALHWFARPGLPLPPALVPAGISFFTFHAISYLFDVYRRQVSAQRSLPLLSLYIVLFPQLIAGPIVRYHDISHQLPERHVHLHGFVRGFERFLVGLGKKMIIANTLAYPADRIFGLPLGELTPGVAWLGMVCYMLQIYFDFSGYSDMAIGLARMFGFKFLENFDYPYVSRSVTEFWRRWHISLSSWFRDYLYVPLGGNRGTRFQTYRNLVLVFFLCGLWHGASWAFVLWGLYHGALLVIERLGFRAVLERAPRFVSHAYLVLAVLLGWLFFRSDGIEQVGAMLSAMLGAPASVPGRSVGEYLDRAVALALVAGCVGSTPVLRQLEGWLLARRRARPHDERGALVASIRGARTLALAGLLLVSIMLMAAGAYSPFIYYRF